MTSNYDVTNFGSATGKSRSLCGRCFNTEVAAAEDLTGFQHFDFEPVRLADSEGSVHEFHFRTRLFGPGLSIDAFELRNGDRGGYEFQVIGEPEDDQLGLLARLIEKIRRALSVRHVVPGNLGPQIADFCVRGRIEWDSAQKGRLPRVMIDGRDFTWEELGRMLMTFEGWQFKLSIHDPSEEP
jgi:hypothetical protein